MRHEYRLCNFHTAILCGNVVVIMSVMYYTKYVSLVAKVMLIFCVDDDQNVDSGKWLRNGVVMQSFVGLCRTTYRNSRCTFIPQAPCIQR